MTGLTELQIMLARSTSDATTAADFAERIRTIGMGAEDIESNADSIRELCHFNGIDEKTPELQEIFKHCTDYKVAQKAKAQVGLKTAIHHVKLN